ncbi:hypothetical protein Tco_0909305, partial [Tanacetum coccineum]
LLTKTEKNEVKERDMYDRTCQQVESERRIYKAEDMIDKDGKVDASKGENGRNGGGVHRQYQRKACLRQEEETMNKSERLIEVEPDEHVNNILEQSIIGKIKKMEFQEKIHTSIQMEELENVLAKYVGGLDIMLIQELVQITKIATNLRINVIEEVRDLVEVEMEEEGCSDSEDDMEDPKEDREYFSWKTGFVAICNAKLLSQYMTTGNKFLTPISPNKFDNQITSKVAEVMLLYSASADDLERVDCLSLF